MERFPIFATFPVFGFTNAAMDPHVLAPAEAAFVGLSSPIFGNYIYIEKK